MKTLANCTPVEFLVQTNKIRKHVANWLTLTKVLEIRKKLPKMSDGMTEEDKKAAIEKQIKTNLSEMLDSVLEKHPKETAELLGLMCFIEPNELDKHRVIDFLQAVTELLNDKAVLSFFISLTKLASQNTSDTASQ